MYKLLVVDDEALVREAIREQMNWRKFGFECIGDCEDGAEALQFIERQQPDVVLTDIYMPFMNGIELAQELHHRYPSVKVIILTGYEDFEYAQQALRLQVADYILKPVTADELEKVLRKLKKDMDAARQQKQDYEQLKHQLKKSWPLLKERFLERFVTSPMTEREKKENFDYFRIGWQGPWLIELAIGLDGFTAGAPLSLSDQELLRFAVYNITQEIIARRDGAEVFRDRENLVLVLLSGEDADRLREDAMESAEEIHRTVTSLLPVRISIGIGHPCEWAGNVLLAHQSAVSALDYRYVTGRNEIIRISDMERISRPSLLSVFPVQRELVTKLKTGTPREMEEWIEGLFAAFRAHVFPIDSCRLCVQQIVLTLTQTLYELTGNVGEELGDAGSLLSEAGRLASLDEMEAWLKALCLKAVAVIGGIREDHNALQIDKAKEYVRRRYSDPDLSLNEVARHVSISPSYFSSLFKRMTGKTFVEYLTEVRMEKARELLRLTSMRTYEIAYAVGYSDPHYFSSAFKKHTGDTPTDYRARILAGKA